MEVRGVVLRLTQPSCPPRPGPVHAWGRSTLGADEALPSSPDVPSGAITAPLTCEDMRLQRVWGLAQGTPLALPLPAACSASGVPGSETVRLCGILHLRWPEPWLLRRYLIWARPHGAVPPTNKQKLQSWAAVGHR